MAFNQDKTEIYSLSDPDTFEVRYIGKANNSHSRFKEHLCSKKKTPVYDWIRELRSKGKAPVMDVIMIAWDWQAAEMMAISQHRDSGKLLNVAMGGNQPFCSKSVRALNGRNNAKAVHGNPRTRRIWELKQAMGLALKLGHLSEQVKIKLRQAATNRPDLFGEWAGI